MRVLIVGDVHFSQYASLVRRRGTEYSKRLENCINSVNWAEQLAEEKGCDKVIYLGDFFDKAEINSEEASALKEIQWSNLPHTILVGNHELGTANGEYSTAQILKLLPNFEIISQPYMDSGFGYRFFYLPYIFERDREEISKYIDRLSATGYMETQEVKHNFIFSHNDLKGVNYGAFESKEGFDVEDIEKHCELFFNGHIHNNGEIGKKIINVGNLTGQNFNEDATRYKHKVYILDIQGCGYNIYEAVNPYAYNFYKLDINNEKDLQNLSSIEFNHAVLSVKCKEHLVQQLKDLLSSIEGIEEYRVVTVVEIKDIPEEDSAQLLTKDHLAQFRDYTIEKLGSTEVVLKELQEVLDVN